MATRTRDCDYFYVLAREEKLLKDHGFEGWPDPIELAEYVFGLSDKIDLILEELGLAAYRDFLGRWHIERARCMGGGRDGS